MLGWQQCAFFWIFVVLTFSVPYVRNIAVRLMTSMLGALVFVVFLGLNTFNHAPSGPGQTVEYYGYPYTYYDSRDGSYRLPRNGSARIPGEHWSSKERFCPPSLLANIAVYLLVATPLAWPICVLEMAMARRKQKPIPTEESTPRNERPSWAR